VQIDRKDLELHLARISCRSQIKEAVFSGAFATAAITPDMLLLVIAPGLNGVDSLEQEIGLADLEKLRTACRLFTDAGEEVGAAADVSVVDNVLVIQNQRGRSRLVTALPKTIATRVAPETVKSLEAQIGDQAIPLTRETIDDVRDAFAGLKAEEVTVEVGPKGGMIRIGGANSDQAELDLEDLKAPEAYELTFSGHLIDVLTTITDEDATLLLAGSGKLIAIRDGEYSYLISPRAPSADNKAAPKKDAKAAPKKGGKKAAAAAAR